MITKENGSLKKPKLNVDRQLEYMKSQGISFRIITEEKAKVFLTDNTYYFNIKTAMFYSRGRPRYLEFFL